jgi:hypothetical protein
MQDVLFGCRIDLIMRTHVYNLDAVFDEVTTRETIFKTCFFTPLAWMEGVPSVLKANS